MILEVLSNLGDSIILIYVHVLLTAYKILNAALISAINFQLPY